MTKSMTLEEGADQRQDFKLVAVALEGETVVVTAQASGQNEAINRQLSSLYQDNIFKRPDFWMQKRMYSAKFTRRDLAVKQNLPWFGIQLFLNLSNITAEEEIDVNQKTLYPASVQLYGMSGDLGVRIKF